MIVPPLTLTCKEVRKEVSEDGLCVHFKVILGHIESDCLHIRTLDTFEVVICRYASTFEAK